MTTARSRISKGRNYQTRITKRIREVFNLGEDDVRSAIGSETGPDIILTSDQARKRFPYAVECKNQKSISIWKALEQACSHCKGKKGKGLRPLLVFKRGEGGTHRSWICLELEEFLEIQRRILDLEKLGEKQV